MRHRSQRFPQGLRETLTSGTTALIGVYLVVAVGDWLAVARDQRRIEYVLKPLALGVLIALAAFWGAPWLLIAALACSLVGDVFLMLPSDRFVQGLVAFLLAHVFYIASYFGAYFDPTPSWVVRALALLLILAASSTISKRIRVGMRSRGVDRLEKPVIAYVMVISVMVFVVVTASVSLTPPQGYLAASGALLFYASDALIGWTRFVRSVPGGRVPIMVTYHLGQLGLVLGLLEGW